MNLIYLPEAAVALAALPRADAKRIRDALEQVARSHPQRMSFVTEIVGRHGFWRLRKGNWRVIYRIDGVGLTVERVGKRGEIYL